MYILLLFSAGRIKINSEFQKNKELTDEKAIEEVMMSFIAFDS